MKKRFYRWLEKQRFKRACKKANYLNELSGKKHIVLKLSGKYYILSKRTIKALQNKGQLLKLHWFKIDQHALYIANNRKNTINQ